MKASILIPTYGNRPQYLRDELALLQAQNFPSAEYEILVIDNGPFSETLQIAKEFCRNGKHPVRYVKETKPGLLEARHAGARQAQGEILVYLDDDVLLPADWLKFTLEPYQDPRVGGTGGKVVLQIEGKAPEWVSHFGSVCHSALDLGDVTLELKWPDCGWGCNMSVRKKVFDEVEGFHPDLFGDKKLWKFIGDGECGFQKKIYGAGYKIIYEPKAWLYHRIPESRLTEAYFYQRVYISGIIDSYTEIRSSKPSVFFPIRLLWGTTVGFFQAGLKYLSSIVKPKWRVRSKAEALYWVAYAKHRIQAVFDKKLRAYIFQRNYL